MNCNATKRKLKTGAPVFGCFVRYPDASLVEFLSYQNWDFLVFDAEHGTIEPRDCEEMTRAAELQGVTPLVRVTTNSPHILLRFLDTGAQGVHVPQVNSGSEAEAAVSSIKYQPRGARGLGGVRAAAYGQRWPLAEYAERANEETLVVLHVETKEAIEQLPRILSVPDIDVMFVGPTDLSQSLNVTGQSQHPSVVSAIDRIADSVLASNVSLGIMVGSLEAAAKWVERGARYITITLEAMLRAASSGYLGPLRASANDRHIPSEPISR